jgi:hypothetical protein
MGFNFERLLDFLYPPLCLHCDAYLERGQKLFCSLCLEQLALLDPAERCPTCFIEKPPAKKCPRCSIRTSLIKRQAAACACFGPARTLASSLKKGHEERIPAIVSLLALQCTQLGWPPHDCVTMLPGSALLAKQMARQSERPFVPLLKARFDKDAFLSRGIFTTHYRMIEKNKKQVWDKRVLVIALELDDLRFRAAASLLQAACAREIYTLSFIDAFQSIDNVQDADDRHALVDTE